MSFLCFPGKVPTYTPGRIRAVKGKKEKEKKSREANPSGGDVARGGGVDRYRRAAHVFPCLAGVP